ncbi:serine/threonine-protein kinase [Streptomyces sp. NPDC047072]|uniref:serine/threonine-protein kinase n=1 Tax=Streptomyces sp. NPDC047072 TaxID=3154809 RepID=UPI0034085CBE
MRGTTVADRYRLTEVVGSGGMGEVWRAEDLQAVHDVALKIIPLDRDMVREAAFRREAGVAERLSHPHVVAVHDHGVAEIGGQRVLFLVMDLVDGQPLSALICRPLPVADTVTWAAQICQALLAAHQAGVVHRDVKPSNLLIDRRSAAMLCDFGIARLPGSHHTLTVTGAAIGTPAFMSPEQARGDKDVGAPSDMYSLGCTIHALLTGRAPFTGAGWQIIHQHLHQAPAALSALRPDVPRELEQLVLELLDKDPGRRPTAAQTLERLDHLRAAVAHAAAPTLTAPASQPAPTVVDSQLPAARSRHGAAGTSTVTGALIAAELTWAAQVPHLWAITLGVLAGLLVSGLHLLDPPSSRPGELQVPTVGLFTMLLAALGTSVALLLTHPMMWPVALAIAVLGGPVLVAGTATVRRAVQHALHRSARQAELTATAGGLHTAALLLAADYAGFSRPAMLMAALVLWPATALFTALVTTRKAAEHRTSPSALRRTGAAAGRTSKAETAVVRS